MNILPLLNIIPPPPSGKSGWPWTKESKPLPTLMPNGKSWPKISIVTPSYNQGQFLEETIRSVLLQNIPNLEYIVMDGGSTDGSLEILKKYEPWLTHWESAKDNGQADAIQRGFNQSKGKFLAWINSDDYYLPGAVYNALKSLIKTPHFSFLVGSSYHLDQNGIFIRKYYGLPQTLNSLLVSGMNFCQPACIWEREMFFELGGLDLSLKFCFDYDLFLRFRERGSFGHTLHPTAVFRWHAASKSSTISNVAAQEWSQIKQRYQLGNEQNNSSLMLASQKHIRHYTRLGKFADIWMDPKWIFRKWITYAP